ncbi:MAG: thiamine biosynthesis protein ThiS [Aquificaceae bacterium]|nr:thiamine biosynthesis protein ThiS [Aquificaceae bacterium]MCS7195894.1 thiamine biosynthesis protein ThiS [Aquificaceae bacterium]MCX7989624.1 thiamine biosynthesis protein ThiS [Aquificaceae bacterium]MDW8033085.1 thiamine biosynthesis protein ThiS [Aquificaceae bacterium]MDW8294816.1 thiamine biosynthesis protein ThiS [Aquificaceae bacterium]
MKVRVVYRGQVKELHFEGERVRVMDVLKVMGLSKEYAFVVRGEEILEEREFLRDGEELRVVNAISGGRGYF